MSPLRSVIARSALVVAAALAAPVVPASAQETSPADTIYELRLGDGTRKVGRVVSRDGTRLTFEDIVGVRTEVNAAYARLRPARGRMVDGEFWPEDRHRTRLFFAPTGRTLPAGDGYAGLFWFLPFAGYGATDALTLAGGMPLAGSIDETPVWVAPKLRVHDGPRAEVSTGIFAVFVPDGEPDEYTCPPEEPCLDAEGGTFAIAYGVGSFGSLDNALHLGLGVSFGSGAAKAGRVPLMIGGELRTGRRWKLITENWIMPGEGAATSLGFRRVGDSWTTDFGWMALHGGDESDIPYFPVLSFSYAFGGRR